MIHFLYDQMECFKSMRRNDILFSKRKFNDTGESDAFRDGTRIRHIIIIR